MTAVQRRRKLDKLHRIHCDLKSEARNSKLAPADRMHLARVADAMRTALEAMEAA